MSSARSTNMRSVVTSTLPHLRLFDLAPLAHQICLLEHSEVPRDLGTGDLGVGGDVTCRASLVTHQREDLSTPRLRDDLQQCAHTESVSKNFRKCQLT